MSRVGGPWPAVGAGMQQLYTTARRVQPTCYRAIRERRYMPRAVRLGDAYARRLRLRPRPPRSRGTGGVRTRSAL